MGEKASSGGQRGQRRGTKRMKKWRGEATD
jgi:hypothetical protein